MKEIKVGIILLFFILGMSLVIGDTKPSLKASRELKEEVIGQITLKTYQLTRETVRTSREYLYQQITGENKIPLSSSDSLKWQEIKKGISELEKNLDFCLQKLQPNNSLYIDISTTKKLLMAARQYNDLQSIIDAYKILHDLEHFFFYHNRNEVYYGVTKTLSGEVKWKSKYVN
ncbi:hypothetical protein [Anaerobranca gottschalkii]|uniref:Uncharacterized protein n=1 Tax=Anaerobranca gottschalkii DSM 13577 TaxID=1120990 RepID=A0A1I0ABN6_9FIRM|nr:hypothetical protein [Anaerobranca gottschalkii]SES91612.1 hypothetical protein SAMN03080614_101929 [Anaerobranca gottschalkii DSM 13577]